MARHAQPLAKRLSAGYLAASLLIGSVAGATGRETDDTSGHGEGNAIVRIAPQEPAATDPPVPVAFTG